MKKEIKRAFNKAFTLVELVVVIAVIAILSGVAVGSYFGIVDSANKSHDETILKQANDILSTHKITDGSSNTNIFDALEDLSSEGLSESELVTKTKDSFFYWDKINDQLQIGNINDETSTYNYSCIAILNTSELLNVDFDSTIKCATYLSLDYITNNTSNINYEYDLENKILTINKAGYIDTSDLTNLVNKIVINDSCDTKKEIIFKTSGEQAIECNFPNGTVYHYGNAGDVILNSIALESWHEFGSVKDISLIEGHLVLEEDSKINSIIIPSSVTSVEKIRIDVSSYKSGRVDIVVKNNELDVAELEKQITQTSGSETTELQINGGKIDDTEVDLSKYEAYVKFGGVTSKTYFTTLDEALSQACSNDSNDYIYVIPGKNVELTKSVELKVNDTLTLPYESEGWSRDNRVGDSVYPNQFADGSEELIKQNKKCEVTLTDRVTLTVSGTLNVGGILGSKTQGLSGFTSGYYAQITMNNNSNIIVNGTLDLRGYIKPFDYSAESSTDSSIKLPELTIKNGAKFYLPFVIYDYAGATATSGIYAAGSSMDVSDILNGKISSEPFKPNGSVFPFNLFDCPNCQVKTIVNSGSNVSGYVSLYTEEKTVVIHFDPSWNNEEISLISTNSTSILTLSSGHIEFYFKKNNKTELTDITAKANKTIVDIYGDTSLGALVMKISAQVVDVEINTSNVFFPLSYHREVNVKNGYTFSNANKLKIMSGGSLVVDSGATLNNSGSIIVYEQEYKDNKTVVCYFPVYSPATKEITNEDESKTKITISKASSSCSVTGEGTLKINGTYVSENNSSIGGKITTSVAGSYLELGNGYKYSVISMEQNGNFTVDMGIGINAKVIFSATNINTQNQTLKIKKINNMNVTTDLVEQTESGSFTSIKKR